MPPGTAGGRSAASPARIASRCTPVPVAAASGPEAWRASPLPPSSSTASGLSSRWPLAATSYVVQGVDGPLYADFHALRHSYLTLGGRSGIDLRTLQELAGHSSPAITARYVHVRLHDMHGAVERLPSFLPGGNQPHHEQAARATGTDGVSPPQTIRIASGPCSSLARGTDGRGVELTASDGEAAGAIPPSAAHNLFPGKGVDGSGREQTVSDAISTQAAGTRPLPRSGRLRSRRFRDYRLSLPRAVT